MQKNQEKKKKMNRKVYAALYVVLSCLLNFLIFILSECILFGVTLLVLHLSKAPESAYSFSLLGAITVGLIVSVIIYTKLSTYLIKKLKLQEKLKDPIADYSYGETKQTNMPDSAFEDQPDEKWQE